MLGAALSVPVLSTSLLILDLSGEWDARAGPCAGYYSFDAQKVGSGLPVPLSPSGGSMLQHLFIGPFFSPQACIVMEPLISMYAGLILLQEMFPSPALRTYLGGVKVMSYFTNL